MLNSIWLKVYLVLIVIISVSFITVNIIAQEKTLSDIRGYLSDTIYENEVDEADRHCPKFDPNWTDSLTRKDLCTGLVWAKNELPTFWDSNKGYNYEQANTACEDYIRDGSGNNLFRLATAEELLSLVRRSCEEGGTCSVQLDDSFLTDINGDNIPDKPYFANGVYWARKNFNEPDSWPDYKRSVNLLNGQADSPVFESTMRLNAWCIMAYNPEIVERKFINHVGGTETVTSADLVTTYHRKCQATADCGIIEGMDFGLCNTTAGYCEVTENVAVNRIIDCTQSTGKVKHIENGACVETTADTCVDTDGDTVDDAGEITWLGNIFNGFNICLDRDCGADNHFDLETLNCESSFRPCEVFMGGCTLSEVDCNYSIPCIENNCDGGTCIVSGNACTSQDDCEANICRDWVLGSEISWEWYEPSDETMGGYWSECKVKDCNFDAIGNGTTSCTCSNDIREGVCTSCADGSHYELLPGDEAACTTALGSWSGTECWTCAANQQDFADCIINEPDSNDYTLGYTQWDGTLFTGNMDCSFESCQTAAITLHYDSQAGYCFGDTQDCTASIVGSEADPYGWVVHTLGCSNNNSIACSVSTEVADCGAGNSCVILGNGAEKTWQYFCYNVETNTATGTDCSLNGLSDCSAGQVCGYWSECEILSCNSPSEFDTDKCKCPAGTVIRGGTCTDCGDGVVDVVPLEQCDADILTNCDDYDGDGVCCEHTSTDFGDEAMCRAIPPTEFRLGIHVLMPTTDAYKGRHVDNLCTATPALGSFQQTLPIFAAEPEVLVDYKFFGTTDPVVAGSGCGELASRDTLAEMISSDVTPIEVTGPVETITPIGCADGLVNRTLGWSANDTSSYCGNALDEVNGVSCTGDTDCRDNFFVSGLCRVKGSGQLIACPLGDGNCYSEADCNLFPYCKDPNIINLADTDTTCAGDWITAAIGVIEDADWLEGADLKELIIIAFTSVKNDNIPDGNAASQDWDIWDYQYMGDTSSNPSYTSLLDVALANDVKITIAYPIDEGLDPGTDCTSWTFNDPYNGFNDDQARWCAFSELALATDGLFVNGFSAAKTAQHLDYIKDTLGSDQNLVEKYCDNDNNNILDCSYREVTVP